MTSVHTAPNPTTVRDPERWAWLPPVLHAVAIGGIPIAVVWATGGLAAASFWVEAVFHLIVSFTLGATLFALVGYLISAPFAAVRRRVRPSTSEDAANYWIVALLILGGTIYFLTEPTLNDFYVRLPTDSANLGAFLILVGSGLLGWALFGVAGSIRRVIGTNRSGQVLSGSGLFSRSKRPWGASPPEPEGAFWSPEPISGWRSWAWNGRSLHGYRIAWTDSLLSAHCDECGESPGWEHACGIYATRDREDVELFGQVPVIGRIEMWGEVVEHEHGYRSSNARITDLWVESAVHAKRIGRAYPGVRVWEGFPTTAEEVSHGEYR